MNHVELYEMELDSAKRCAIYFADRSKLLEQRMCQLEQLCRDMYENIEVGGYISVYRQHLAEADFRERMTDLGLLEMVDHA